MCLCRPQTSKTVKDLAHSAELRTFSLFGTIFREYNLGIERDQPNTDTFIIVDKKERALS